MEYLIIHTRLLGSQHPGTLVSIGNLGITFGRLSRHTEATPLLEETVDRRAGSCVHYGEDHDQTRHFKRAARLSLERNAARLAGTQ